MPAGMELTDTMFSVREVPWHRQGEVLAEAPKDIDEAVVAAGLDWEPVSVPLRFTNPITGEEENDDARLLMHPVTGRRLGRVTNDYKVLANREAFSFLANLVGTDMMYETAGSLHGGRRVYVTTRLPEWIEVGGDTTGVYAFITNSHSGWEAIKVRTSTIRIVCQNTLSLALGQGASRGTNGNVMSIPHFGDVQSKLVAARDTLGMTVNYAQQFKKFGDALASSSFTERKMKAVLEELYPSETASTDRKKANAVDHQNMVMWMWKEGKTNNEFANAPGTAWTALQAITEYVDFGEEIRGAEEKEDRADRQVVRAFDDPTNKKAKAARLIAKKAEVALA